MNTRSPTQSSTNRNEQERTTNTEKISPRPSCRRGGAICVSRTSETLTSAAKQAHAGGQDGGARRNANHRQSKRERKQGNHPRPRRFNELTQQDGNRMGEHAVGQNRPRTHPYTNDIRATAPIRINRTSQGMKRPRSETKGAARHGYNGASKQSTPSR